MSTLDQPLRRHGFLVILSGPSGAGKNTVLNALLPHVPDMRYSVSATTRPPRAGEVHGQDYFFLSDSEFDEKIKQNDFLEWAEFCGYRYGTPRKYVEEMLAKGIDVITDVDIQGAVQIRQVMPNGVFVFLLPPSIEELRNRIETRGTDSADAITRRLSVAPDELRHMVHYDYVILNDDLEHATQRLAAIVLAEGLRVSRVDSGSIYDQYGDVLN